MYKDVYIGLAHDKAFDFDKEGNWNGYMSLTESSIHLSCYTY